MTTPPLHPPTAPGAPGPRPSNTGAGLAVTAMILGICGLCVPLVGLIGAALGVIALSRRGTHGRGMAIAGVALGVLGLAATGFVVLGMALPFFAHGSRRTHSYTQHAASNTGLSTIAVSTRIAQLAAPAFPVPGTDLESALAHSVPADFWISPRAHAASPGAHYLVLKDGCTPGSTHPFMVENPAVIPDADLYAAYTSGYTRVLPRAEVERLIRRAGTGVFTTNGTRWTPAP